MIEIPEITAKYNMGLFLSEKPKILSTIDAANILKKIWPDDINLYERFYILLLNQNCNLLGYSNISIGTFNSCHADPYKIMQLSLISHASAIILAHNHPSGILVPSDADLKMTERIVTAGKILNIKIFDHIILTPNESYFSFLDEGKL